MADIDWEIRPAEPRDHGAIRALLSASFDSPAEADLTDALRAAGDVEIELVADTGDEIIGHIVLSRMISPQSALGLGPVATAAPCRGSGVASSLIESGLALASANDWRLVFLLGDAAFYERYGFSVADAEAFTSPYAGPHWQVTFLDEDAPRSGNAVYAEAFKRFED